MYSTKAIRLKGLTPPLPRVLKVHIGGLLEQFRWELVKPMVVIFSQKTHGEHSNTLLVDWVRGEGRCVLHALFRHLSETILTRCSSGTLVPHKPLSSFKRISISVPLVVRNLRRSVEDGVIDLRDADRILEFNWDGDFCLFALTFRGLLSDRLTVLKISGCFISTDDTVALLHACPNVKTADIKKVCEGSECDLPDTLTPSAEFFQRYYDLSSFTLVSTVPLSPIIMRMAFLHRCPTVKLLLGPEATEDILAAIRGFPKFTKLTIRSCYLQPDVVAAIQG
ncbi:hypothetical protein BDZ97DRAFT_1856327, partial [Flammula alnicola]